MSKKKVVKREEKEHHSKEPEFSDEQLLDALKAIGHPASSREISDKLGIKDADYGRQMIRARMARLIEEKKVAAEVPKENKSRAKQLYKLA